MRSVILVLAVAGCGVELEHGLDERQANQVVTLLESAGVAADKVRDEAASGTYKIVVPRGEAGRAFQLLDRHDLPRRGQKGLQETFGGARLMPSPIEERARLQAALAAELERSLEALPGVTAARVHLALPEAEPLPGETPVQRPTASVLVKTRTGALPVGEADVKKLVAGAVQALKTEDVSVVVAAVPAEPEVRPLDRLGPLRVAPESRRTLTTLAASGLALLLLLSVAMVIAARRLAVLRRRLTQLQTTNPPRT